MCGHGCALRNIYNRIWNIRREGKSRGESNVTFNVNAWRCGRILTLSVELTGRVFTIFFCVITSSNNIDMSRKNELTPLHGAYKVRFLFYFILPLFRFLVFLKNNLLFFGWFISAANYNLVPDLIYQLERMWQL